MFSAISFEMSRLLPKKCSSGLAKCLTSCCMYFARACLDASVKRAFGCPDGPHVWFSRVFVSVLFELRCMDGL